MPETSTHCLHRSRWDFMLVESTALSLLRFLGSNAATVHAALGDPPFDINPDFTPLEAQGSVVGCETSEAAQVARPVPPASSAGSQGCLGELEPGRLWYPGKSLSPEDRTGAPGWPREPPTPTARWLRRPQLGSQSRQSLLARPLPTSVPPNQPPSPNPVLAGTRSRPGCVPKLVSL